MVSVLSDKLRLSLVAVGLLALQSCAGMGCIMLFTEEGGGELAVGMRNDNFLVVRHSVDGDKEGKKATASVELQVDPVLTSLLGGDTPASEDGEEVTEAVTDEADEVNATAATDDTD